MRTVIDYLTARLEKYSHNNRGVELLKKYRDKFDTEARVLESLGIMMNQFKKGDEDDRATAKLTALSCALGSNIADSFNIQDTYKEHLAIGDLILEAFFNNQIIDIERLHNGVAAPYIVKQGPNWGEVRNLSDSEVAKIWAKRTSNKPIPMIKDLYQAHGKPIIKHWRRNKSEQFKEYLDRPFIAALNKLQRTGWKINNDVLDAVLSNKDKLVSESIEVVDEDTGEIVDFDIYTDYDDLQESNYYWEKHGKMTKFKPHLSKWAQRREKDAHAKRRRLENKFKKKPEQLEINEEYIKLRKEENRFGYQYSVYREADKEIEKLKSKADVYTFVTKEAILRRNEVFYQYVDLDYRGRVYYMQPFLNYQSNDVARGLLLFNEGKVLDKKGLRPLCIHIANSFNQSYNLEELAELPYANKNYIPHLQEQELESLSVDKFTLDDKVNWVLDNMQFVSDVARQRAIVPEAEKPVIFLAACIELDNYFNAEEVGKVYYSHLPIPIDGSNNGWQHLAAISKDEQAGDLVGLVPSEVQKDFYVQTAKELYHLVPEGRLKDLLTEMPMKEIRKGISKRGSMTRAYSAGKFAIATNMYEDCRVEGYTKKYGISKVICNDLAHYLIEAINNVCPGPLTTMEFLQNIAVAGITDEKDNKDNFLRWETPSGFPVEYSCWKMEKLKFKGSIKGIGRIEHVIQEPTTEPNRDKYHSGISPNYVHSQDAAHMSLIISKWGKSFAGVHDSFSCHACDVDKLVSLTKSTFIDMYDKADCFEDILKLFKVDVDKPKLGNLNIKDVEKSNYFFA